MLRTVTRALAGCAFVVVSIDPARLLTQAFMLERARRAYPELFDGEAALESILGAIEDALALEP